MDRPRITLLGRRALRARGRPVRGMVLSVRTLWWIKVNTKPARRHMADGARFPHALTFAYQVDGRRYTGRAVLYWYVRCPCPGEAVEAHCDPARPRRCVLTPPGAALGDPP